MTATNHGVTGSVIGLATGAVWLAIPLALLSHIICDVIPHFGREDAFMRTKAFRRLLVADAFVCLAVVGLLVLLGSPHWPLAVLCGIVAILPDALWLRKLRAVVRGHEFKPTWIEDFLHRIQWYERPRGAYVEAVWFMAGIALIFALS